MSLMKSRTPRVAAAAGLCLAALLAPCGAPMAEDAHRLPLEFGVDRSNMGTQWTLAPPQEPNVSPFLKAEYDQAGNFEARRIAVLDGITRIHARWFRDGFGGTSPDLSVDILKLVHERGMK